MAPARLIKWRCYILQPRQIPKPPSGDDQELPCDCRSARSLKALEPCRGRANNYRYERSTAFAVNPALALALIPFPEQLAFEDHIS